MAMTSTPPPPRDRRDFPVPGLHSPVLTSDLGRRCEAEVDPVGGEIRATAQVTERAHRGVEERGVLDGHSLDALRRGEDEIRTVPDRERRATDPERVSRPFVMPGHILRAFDGTAG